MSWKLVGRCSEKRIGSPSRRLLLLSMCDKANDDGSGVYASFATLGEMSELGRSTARRIVKEFEAEGLVTQVGEVPCENGYTNNYTINLDALAALPDNIAVLPPKRREAGKLSDPVRSEPGPQRTRSKVNPVRSEPQTQTPLSLLTVEKEDSPPADEQAKPDPADLYVALGGRAPSEPTVSGRKSQLPENFALDEKMRAAARELGIIDERIDSVFGAFCDWHGARGSQFVNWRRAWSGWCRKDGDFNGRPDRARAAGAGAAGASTQRDGGGGRGSGGISTRLLQMADKAREIELRMDAEAGGRRRGG